MEIVEILKGTNPEWLRYYDADNYRIIIALILAIQFGDLDSVKILIPVQPDINALDNMGDWTALMHAVNEGSLDIVKLLVEAGADVNIRGSFEPEEEFALNMAAYTKNREIFDFLFPLTSPELQEIAKKTLEQGTGL